MPYLACDLHHKLYLNTIPINTWRVTCKERRKPISQLVCHLYDKESLDTISANTCWYITCTTRCPAVSPLVCHKINTWCFTCITKSLVTRHLQTPGVSLIQESIRPWYVPCVTRSHTDQHLVCHVNTHSCDLYHKVSVSTTPGELSVQSGRLYTIYQLALVYHLYINHSIQHLVCRSYSKVSLLPHLPRTRGVICIITISQEPEISYV